MPVRVFTRLSYISVRLSTDKFNSSQVLGLCRRADYFITGKVVPMKTRFLYKCLLHRASWNSLVHVYTDAMGEITFFLWGDAHILNDRGMGIELDNSCK